MYNLRHPGALIQDYTPNQDEDVLRHAKYSCVYWADHLKAVNDLEREKCLQDHGIVHHFLEAKLLNWLEALSLMKKTPDAARVARFLKKLTTKDERIMRNLIEDIFRFVLAHKVGIELAPLQVYSSALIFSPSSSIIRRTYEETEVPKWIVTKPKMPVEWTARVQSFEGSKARCQALEFSPDGAQIASANDDGTVRIWDLGTGVCLHKFKCSSNVYMLTFSPNGKHLTTGAYLSVEIWDLSTSTRLLTFESEAFISSLAFSFDGTQFAAGYNHADFGSFIRAGDLGIGIELKTHNLGTGMAECRCTAFAPDGTHFACVENRNDERIHIWNLTTDGHLPAVEMTTVRFISPRFSADAAQLAVAAEAAMNLNNIIHIFETSKGACILKISQLNNLNQLNFLATPTRLVTKSRVTDFRIWDSVTGKCLWQFNFDRRCRVSAFSSDGMLAVSEISDEGIWELGIHGPIDAFEATIGGFVQATVFSPDGTQLAIAPSYSGEGCAIQIHDPATGNCLKQFEYAQDKYISSMVISPDGNRLVSTGWMKIEVWDVSSGVSLQSIDIRGEDAWSLGYLLSAISPDGSRLATMPSREYINIMQLPSGKISRRITYSDNRPLASPVAAAFSPDGIQLGLTLASGAVLIFDVQTGVCLQDVDNFFEPLIHGFGFPRLRLQTDLRIFGYQDCIKTPPTQQALMRRPLSAFTTSKDGMWIMRGKQRMLWLAPEYRPSAVEVYDEFVTCVTDHGEFFCLRFAVGELDKVLA